MSTVAERAKALLDKGRELFEQTHFMQGEFVATTGLAEKARFCSVGMLRALTLAEVRELNVLEYTQLAFERPGSMDGQEAREVYEMALRALACQVVMDPDYCGSYAGQPQRLADPEYADLTTLEDVVITWNDWQTANWDDPFEYDKNRVIEGFRATAEKLAGEQVES